MALFNTVDQEQGGLDDVIGRYGMAVSTIDRLELDCPGAVVEGQYKFRFADQMYFVLLRSPCPLDALIAELFVNIHLTNEFILVFVDLFRLVNEADEGVHPYKLFER